MIFYFSGTGNSEAVAKRLAKEGENLISMVAARRHDTYEYAPKTAEPVGFVFPVYFYGVPDTVRVFIRDLKLTQKPGYVYAVITCGGSIAGAGGILKKYLSEAGIELNAVYSVKMPDNYVFLYDVTTQEEEKPILADAEAKLNGIATAIDERREEGTDISTADRMKSAALYPMYDRFRKTAKFRTDEKCVGCGVCAKRCPCRAIEMIDGKPLWVKDKCDHCMSCVRCNAIQYGKRTVGKYRYRHPDLRKK